MLVRAPGPKTTGLHSGLVGDQIFDVENHGGDDQAVYAYAREDYDWWERQLCRHLPGGTFGENLTVSGIDCTAAVLGETWRIGKALQVRVTGPRIPCVTFQERMGEPHWLRTFSRQNRPGAYLSVVTEGPVQAGDPIEVVHRPEHGFTVAHSFHGWMFAPQSLRPMLDADGLPDGMKAEIRQRLRL